MSTPDVHALVVEHFDRPDLSTVMVEALRDSGVDVDQLVAQDLHGVDHLHAGGADTTKRVLGLAGVGADTRLLDVGCGVGGTARLAALSGATVEAVDLTPGFIEAAEQLTERVGLADRITYTQTPGERLPFNADCFDAATLIHVAMNTPDKQGLFAEAHRVLRPHSPLVVFDQMRTGRGQLPFPLPWARDERISFIETPEEYADHLELAGFTVTSVEDHTPPEPGMPVGLGPGVVLGDDFGARVANNIRATQLGILGSVIIVATA